MRLHQNFREVVATVGPEIAAKISYAATQDVPGSHRIYVPHTIDQTHKLASVLDQDQCRRLSNAFGGCMMRYSSPASLRRTAEAQRKRARINALLDSGMRPSAVAAQVGVSKAYITRFMRRRAIRSNENQ